MEKNKGLVVSVIVLLAAVLLLGGYIIYDKTNSNDVKITKKVEDVKETDDKKVKYTYKSIAGVYKFTSNPYGEENESDDFTLSLFENGVFHYEQSRMVNSGFFGNYTINNNKINLNYIFMHGSDAALHTIIGDDNKSKYINDTLTISSENTIIDSNIIGENFKNKYTKVELTKTNEKLTDDVFEEILNKYILISQGE